MKFTSCANISFIVFCANSLFLSPGFSMRTSIENQIVSTDKTTDNLIHEPHCKDLLSSRVVMTTWTLFYCFWIQICICWCSAIIHHFFTSSDCKRTTWSQRSKRREQISALNWALRFDHVVFSQSLLVWNRTQRCQS